MKNNGYSLSLYIYREREGEFPAHAEKEVSKK